MKNKTKSEMTDYLNELLLSKTIELMSIKKGDNLLALKKYRDLKQDIDAIRNTLDSVYVINIGEATAGTVMVTLIENERNSLESLLKKYRTEVIQLQTELKHKKDYNSCDLKKYGKIMTLFDIIRDLNGYLISLP